MENSEQIPPGRTPGALLREAREQAGISPREMADRLNWLPAHIAAVEENRFEGLRGAAFVRGYLRAYARALGLDEDEMVALYAAMQPEKTTPDRPPSSSASPATPGQNAALWIVVCCVFAVAMIAGISWFQGRDDGTAAPVPAQETPTDTAAVQAVGEPDSEPAGAGPAAAEAAPDQAPAEPAAPEVNRVDSTAPEMATPEPEVEPGPQLELEPEAEAASAMFAGDGLSQPSAAADALLEFSFSGDCWIEVRDGDGELIYADLRGPGDTLRLDGKPPFEVLAGDAASVSLLYRGEPFPVRTRPGRDTARFTVGEP